MGLRHACLAPNALSRATSLALLTPHLQGFGTHPSHTPGSQSSPPFPHPTHCNPSKHNFFLRKTSPCKCFPLPTGSSPRSTCGCSRPSLTCFDDGLTTGMQCMPTSPQSGDLEGRWEEDSLHRSAYYALYYASHTWSSFILPTGL